MRSTGEVMGLEANALARSSARAHRRQGSRLPASSFTAGTASPASTRSALGPEMRSTGEVMGLDPPRVCAVKDSLNTCIKESFRSRTLAIGCRIRSGMTDKQVHEPDGCHEWKN
jgi:hypothetical protein